MYFWIIGDIFLYIIFMFSREKKTFTQISYKSLQPNLCSFEDPLERKEREKEREKEVRKKEKEERKIFLFLIIKKKEEKSRERRRERKRCEKF